MSKTLIEDINQLDSHFAMSMDYAELAKDHLAWDRIRARLVSLQGYVKILEDNDG